MDLKELLNLQLILISVLSVIDCLNILAIMPHEGKSHQLVFEPLFKKLVSNGHKLTLITRFPQSTPVPNWRDISVAPEVMNSSELISFSLLTGTRIDKYGVIPYLANSAYTNCKEGLSHPNYQKFIKEKNSFDILMVEVFNTPCFMGVTKKFDAPVIGISSGAMMPWMYQWFGSASNPAYVPNHFLGTNVQMSFLERVENTVMYVYSNLVYTMFMDFFGNRLSEEYTGIDSTENGDVMKNIRVLLMNSHYTLHSPIPLSPNSIQIGGIHVDGLPVKQLPQDLDKFVRESKDGVIYMSMGSTVKGETFPEDKKQAFLTAFSKLPQRVVWKWEGDMKNKPDNVMIYRWAPQRDVLCHPNVKLFISHGGLLGVIESLDCGKPIMMLPLYGDQFTNAKAVEKNGGGLILGLNDISEEVVFEMLQKLLSSEYKDSALELSKRFKDRPQSPMDTALYWIDYVARHKGATFMKVASVDLPSYQYYLLDVMAFVLVTIVSLGYIFYLIVKFIFEKLFANGPKAKKS